MECGRVRVRAGCAMADLPLLETVARYPRAAYEAARRRFLFRPKEGQMEASVVFDQKLYAYSGSFALMYLDVSVSSAFQSGNKVCYTVVSATCAARTRTLPTVANSVHCVACRRICRRKS